MNTDKITLYADALADVLNYFDRDNVDVPKDIYKKVFNTLYPPSEENKSNDSFQWSTELVKKYLFDEYEMEFNVDNTIKHFIQKNTPKPQAENKPEWEIECLSLTCHEGYKELVTSYTKDKLVIYNWLNGDERYSGYKIHSVKRLSDGEVFSVGDEVVHKTDGLINTAKILKFVIPQIVENRMWFEFEEGEDYVKDLANFNRLPPQPQKEEQRIEVKIVGKFQTETSNYQQHIQFITSANFPSEKMNQIKQAIEQVLNDEVTLNTKKIESFVENYGAKFYNQQQVDSMCEDAFNAAKLCENGTTVAALPMYPMYRTFEDYKSQNSKQK